MCLICVGWHLFTAVEGENNDGEENCAASIAATIGGVARSFDGKTGNQQGHAEIHALVKLLKDPAINWNPALFSAAHPVVSCEVKACCLGCSAVLGLLGVRPRATTLKSRSSSAGPKYGVSPDLRTFIKAYIHAYPRGINATEAAKAVETRFCGGGACAQAPG
jgi:hypothetical protein